MQVHKSRFEIGIYDPKVDDEWSGDHRYDYGLYICQEQQRRLAQKHIRQ